MEKSQLRQRLIGALVLVALFAIMVPFFLGDQPDTSAEHIASIPPASEQISGADIPIEEGAPETPVDEVTVNESVMSSAPSAIPNPDPLPAKDPVKNEIAATATSPDTASASATTSAKPPAQKSTTSPIVSSKVTRNPSDAPARAWVVQLGSFSSEKNAWALRDKLRNKGYHAFVERISEGRKMVIRVRIGPETRRATAQAVQQKLEKEMKIKGIVMLK